MSADEFVNLLEANGYKRHGDVFEKQGPEYTHRFKVEVPMVLYCAVEPDFNMAFNLDSFHPDELQWVEEILSNYFT